MCVCGCEIDDYFLTWNPVALALKGCDGPQKALLHGDVCKTAEVYPNPQRNVDLNGHPYSVYAYTFGSIYVCQHFFLIFASARVNLPI